MHTTGHSALEKYGYDASTAVSSCAMYSYSGSSENPICYYNYKNKLRIDKFMIAPRILDFCSVFIFYDGNFGFIFDDIAFHPSAGDIFIVRNNVEFSTFFPEYTHMDCYEITFPMDLFNHFMDDNIFRRIFFEDNKSGAKLISADHMAADTILSKFNELDVLISKKNKNLDILAYSYIIQVLGIIDSQMHNRASDTGTVKVPKKLKEAVNYIHANFTEPITVGEISAACGISNTYLARMFKTVYRSTPLEYLTGLRITHARTLLANGSGISEACYDSGFNDYNHFITKFKAVTGITPSKYQKGNS